MENFKALLEQQKEALTKDIDAMIVRVKQLEEELEVKKEEKSQAKKELRSIERGWRRLTNELLNRPIFSTTYYPNWVYSIDIISNEISFR